MPHIVLTADQARTVAQAADAVEARDGEGHVLAHIHPLTAEVLGVLELHRMRKGQPKEKGVPGAQVHAHFRRLEEIRERKGMDEAKLKELLRRMRAGEEV